MSRLTFDGVLYDRETITTRQVFDAVIALMERMERLELVAGQLSNIVLTLSTDDELPNLATYEKTLTLLDEFVHDLAEEVRVHRAIRDELSFLHTPE